MVALRWVYKHVSQNKKPLFIKILIRERRQENNRPTTIKLFIIKRKMPRKQSVNNHQIIYHPPASSGTSTSHPGPGPGSPCQWPGGWRIKSRSLRAGGGSDGEIGGSGGGEPFWVVGGCGGGQALVVLEGSATGSATHRDVAESAALGPVATTVLA